MSRSPVRDAIIEALCRRSGVSPPELEYRFCADRRWRFDYAWPAAMVALEIEGGTWIDGRHVQAKGYEADCEKYNTAVLVGWRVFRLTSDQFDAGHFLAEITQLIRLEALGTCD